MAGLGVGAMSDAETITWTDEMVQAWQQTRSTIYSVLAQAGRAADTEDVWQKTWVAAAESLERFDSELGTFRQWVGGIAYRQAKRHLRDEYGQANISGAVEHAATSGISTVYDVTTSDIAEEVTSKMSDWSRVSLVLSIARRAVGNPALFDRSMYLMIACDGDVATASKRLDLSPAALRDSHRNVMDVTHVVDRSLDHHWRRRETGAADAPVTVRDLLRSLPSDDDDSRAWVHTITRAVVAAGGFGAVSASQVAELTGWSEVYARHCLARTSNLLMIARSVIEDGTL